MTRTKQSPIYFADAPNGWLNTSRSMPCNEKNNILLYCGLISAWTRRSSPSLNPKASLSSAYPHHQKIVRIKVVVSCAEMLYSVIAIINSQKEIYHGRQRI